MRRPGSRSVARFAIFLLPWIVGCAGPKPTPAQFDSLPILSLAPDALAAVINQAAASVPSLKGKLDLAMRVPPADAFKHCRGVLAARSPWSDQGPPGLFLEGYRQIIPTLFTLVSDGREFWLHVPYDNTAYTGPLGGPHPVRHGREIQLDVLDLFRALFVEPIAPTDSFDVTEAGVDYIVSISRDEQVQRRLWIDRRSWAVTREVYYGPQGQVRLQIDREAYADLGAQPYPMHLTLRDLANGHTVVLEFGSLTLRPETLDDRIFQPNLPPGTVVRRTDPREARG